MAMDIASPREGAGVLEVEDLIGYLCGDPGGWQITGAADMFLGKTLVTLL